MDDQQLELMPDHVGREPPRVHKPDEEPVPGVPGLTYGKAREVRRAARTGDPDGDDTHINACSVVSERLKAMFPHHLGVVNGRYVPPEEDGLGYGHTWNTLPDGRIFDATADQFTCGPQHAGDASCDDAEDIIVAPRGDPRYRTP